MHEQLSDKLRSLEKEQFKRVEESLDTLIALLGIYEIEAIPVVTIDSYPEEMDQDGTNFK